MVLNNYLRDAQNDQGYKESDFLEILGAIDPSLKQQTLLQYQRINKIKNLRQTPNQIRTRNKMKLGKKQVFTQNPQVKN